MAVLEVIELGGGGHSGGSDVESGGRYVREYQVEFDAPNGDAVAAILASGIPDYGDAYPSDSSSFVTGKEGSQEGDNPCIWTVRVTYSVPRINSEAPASPDAPSGGSGGTTSPIQSQKITWRSYTKTVAFVKDKAGNLVKNAAGDPFDPSFTRELRYPELVVVRTQSSFNVQWKLDYEGKKNDAAVTIGGKVFGAETLRVTDIVADYPTGPSNNLWQVTITIRYDPLLHKLVALNAGLREKLVLGIMVPIMDGGVPVGQPVPLTAAGRRLAVGAAENYLTFDDVETVDFTKLYLDY
jgi:hypothetical protein